MHTRKVLLNKFGQQLHPGQVIQQQHRGPAIRNQRQVVVNRPTASLVRRPSTTPLRYVIHYLYRTAINHERTASRLLTHHVSLISKSRIDACIVGDPNACLEPNESCQVEEDGSACSCKPGFWVGKNQVISAKSAKAKVLLFL